MVDQEPIFELEFSKAESNYLEFAQLAQKLCYGSLRRWLNVAAPLIAGLVGGSLLWSLDRSSLEFDEYVFDALVGASALFLFSYLVNCVFRPRFVDADGSFKAQTQISFSKDGIADRTEHSTSFTSWKLVKRVEQTRSSTILFTDKTIGFVIPNEAWRTQEEKAEAIKFFRSQL
ncbi:MAG: YcxB family protein, partial [Pseudomonadota bacterium]